MVVRQAMADVKQQRTSLEKVLSQGGPKLVNCEESLGQPGGGGRGCRDRGRESSEKTTEQQQQR